MGFMGQKQQSAALKKQEEAAAQAAEAARIQAARRSAAQRFSAEQLRALAGQEIASSQRSAFDQERTARLVQSRALAVAAASGGSAADPTVVSLLARTEGEGYYRASVALYEGQEAARRLRMEASARDYEAALELESGAAGAEAYTASAQAYGVQRRAQQLQGYSNLLGSAGSMYQKYAATSAQSQLGPQPIPEMVPGQYSLTNPAYG